MSAYFIVPVDPSITTIAEAQQPNSLTDAVPQVIGGALPMEQIAQFVGTLRENGDNPITRNDVVVILSKSKIEALGLKGAQQKSGIYEVGRKVFERIVDEVIPNREVRSESPIIR